MELFQILDCNSALGTCCTDYELVGILGVTSKVFGLIQFLVPTILIIAGTIQFVQLAVNPELKDGFRKVLNKLIAALIIFLLPSIVDLVLGATQDQLNVATCWAQAKTVANENLFKSDKYHKTAADENTTVWLDPISFTKFSSIGVKSGSTKQQAIVEYANMFVGEDYDWGGEWNGELPYVPTDCSGFVVAIFRHFGIDLSAGLHQNMFGYHTELYDEVDENHIEPGDVIMYNGHVGILTGNGNEIIHAKNTALGVVKDPDYKTCSGKEIMGILRIKGVK